MADSAARIERAPSAPSASPFWIAGFECASQRRKDGVRLDLLSGTKHDRFALSDYQACVGRGFRAARDGLRWHLIERRRGRYDWSSWLPMVEAAEEAGIDVQWDVFHYGWPSFLDPRNDEFIERFAAYAAAAAETHLRETGRAMRMCLINEISFLTWSFEVGFLPPSVKDHPIGWMKRRLVKCAIAAEAAIKASGATARLGWAEPLIHVPPPNGEPKVVERACQLQASQFEAYDMLLGRSEPELGGHEDMIHAMGLNYYPANQWYSTGGPIPLGHHEYVPLSQLLIDYHARYGRPLTIAETGAEASARAAWIHYVGEEVLIAMRAGVPIDGICLYPITDYPGWDDDRHCPVGLFGYADEQGQRPVDGRFAAEVSRQQSLFNAYFAEAGAPQIPLHGDAVVGAAAPR